MTDPFGHAAGVHEDERGGVSLDELGDVIEDFAHLLSRRNRLHLRWRNAEVEIEPAGLPPSRLASGLPKVRREQSSRRVQTDRCGRAVRA